MFECIHCLLNFAFLNTLLNFILISILNVEHISGLCLLKADCIFVANKEFIPTEVSGIHLFVCATAFTMPKLVRLQRLGVAYTHGSLQVGQMSMMSPIQLGISQRGPMSNV